MLDEGFRKLVERVEIIRCVVQIFAPVEAEPFNRIEDRIDVLRILLDRVGVVEAHVAAAVVLQRHAEVQADRFRVAVMQVAVGLGREPRADLCGVRRRGCVCRRRARLATPFARGVRALREVGFDDVADEIGDLGDGMRLRLIAGCWFVHAGFDGGSDFADAILMPRGGLVGGISGVNQISPRRTRRTRRKGKRER